MVSQALCIFSFFRPLKMSSQKHGECIYAERHHFDSKWNTAQRILKRPKTNEHSREHRFPTFTKTKTKNIFLFSVHMATGKWRGKEMKFRWRKSRIAQIPSCPASRMGFLKERLLSISSHENVTREICHQIKILLFPLYSFLLLLPSPFPHIQQTFFITNFRFTSLIQMWGV